MNALQPIAVLTGDLVNSAGLGPDRIARAFHALEVCAATQAVWMGAPLRFTRNRGDGWQVALARPERALRSALAFRAALRCEGREFDSYMSIAEGPAPLGLSDDLNGQTDEVFIRSGRGLDDLKTTNTSVRIVHDRIGPVDAATLLADHLSQGWTRAQAQAILPMLAPDFDDTYSGLAQTLGKSRQAVTKALTSAGEDVLNLALASLEKGYAHG